jgi:hypothetical protein
MQTFLSQVLQVTAVQILALFGIFFVFGFLLSEIQDATLGNYRRSVGWRGILWTAWLGTPVHEYSHAFFAKLFRHKIDKVVLFSPDARTGELGRVDHSYNPKSFYQNVGNFFIGSAPLIIGPLVLVVLLYVMLPEGREIFSQLSGSQTSLALLWSGIRRFVTMLFTPGNLKSYSFWIFLYISFCIASHLAPSREDRKGIWRGWLLIILSLFLANLLALLLHRDITDYILNFSNFFTGMITVYIYVMVISLIHFSLSFLILLPWRK